MSIPRPNPPSRTQPSIAGPDLHPRAQNSIQDLPSASAQNSIWVPYPQTQNPVLYQEPLRPTSGSQTFRPRQEVHPEAQTWNPESSPVSGARTSIRGSDQLAGPRFSARRQKSIPQLRPRSQNPVLYQVPRPLSGGHTSILGSDQLLGPRLKPSRQKSILQLTSRTQNPELYRLPRPLSGAHSSIRGSDLHPVPDFQPGPRSTSQG
uniref:Uncharacterized protein n=1 Tax=Myotis myotis TaxID=51298 RepID=A0A7J7Y084_MYOMY|nr:hypothetical protein mMyoMyo1_011388 [Myotis myotis]